MRARSYCSLLSVAAAALLALPNTAQAQACPGPSDTFWKNDVLVDDPVGIVPVGAAVLTPFCQGEAAGSYFQLAPGSAPQYLKQVSMGFGDIQNAGTFQAVLNIEIYEGTPTFNPGFNVIMPPKVFDLAIDGGTSMNVTSSGMQSFDLSPYNIVLEDDFIVAFRLVQNVSFSICQPATIGHDANMLTDAAANLTCVSGKNLLDERDNGWVDPADWLFDGFISPICPTFYAGNFLIRACTEDAGTWVDEGGGTSGAFGPVTLTGTGPLTFGSLNPVTLTNATPGAIMLSWISFTSTPVNFFGGTIYANPFNVQLIFIANAGGGFSGAAPWPALPPGTEVWFQFLVEDNTVIFGITLSNAMKATTP